VVAFGSFIPQSLLALPKHGWVNLHFSLLPAWRGAAPVQHAILNGDDITGACTFHLEAGLDTGPIFGSVTEPIAASDTSGDLLQRLAVSGAQLLLHTADGIESGTLRPVAQPAEGVSLAPKLSVGDARIDWATPALHIDRLVRACTPSPGAWTTFRGERLKILPMDSSSTTDVLPAGTLEVTKSQVQVGTGSRRVTLSQVQPQGKRPMSAADWARGARVRSGELFQ
jgi:methionyl-tRNA formyltransferase